MILDSSAVVAVARLEPDAAEFARAIEQAGSCKMSTATFLEAAIVLDSRSDPTLGRRYDDLLRESKVALVALDDVQARIAREAYRDFGKGSGHPAKLNFGDCFAYALAKATGEPLLFKGNDFAHTDVRTALPR
jgi:ribonuclease VapC